MTTIDYSKFEGHTPGPWKSVPTGRPSRPPFIRTAYVLPNAKIGLATAKIARQGKTDQEIEANAELIAAAPTLLARCKELEEENARLHERLQRLEREKDARLARGALAAKEGA